MYCAAKIGLPGLTWVPVVELRRSRVSTPSRLDRTCGRTMMRRSTKRRVRALSITRCLSASAVCGILRAVRFLFNDAPYVIGQIINVDGDRTAHL
jgi:hypothetical protein